MGVLVHPEVELLRYAVAMCSSLVGTAKWFATWLHHFYTPTPQCLRLLIELNFSCGSMWQSDGGRWRAPLGKRNIMEAHADHENVPLRSPAINPAAEPALTPLFPQQLSQ